MEIHNLKLYKRIDIFVKILYIKSFLEKKNFEYYQSMYRKHIKLYNWWLEDDKMNINDFEKSFQKLILNIKNNWFNNNFPIPITSNWEIINWAHRVACCIYFWIQPIFKYVINEEITWDFNWFKLNRFTTKELMEIMNCVITHLNYSIIIVWPTLNKNIEKITDIFNSNFKIIWNLNLDFNENLNELINDVYSFDKNEVDLWLSFFEKWELLKKYWNNINIYVLNNHSNETLKLKENLRDKLINFSDLEYNSKNLYNTFHSSDNSKEAKYLSQILFNYGSYEYLKKRKFRSRKIFNDRLIKLKKYIINNELNINDFCIVWSWPLEIFNLDKTSDIDIIKSSNNNNWILKITPDIDLLDYDYWINISNSDIIDNHYFYFRGLKFITLKQLVIVKSFWLRDKDILHVKKINEFLFSDISNSNIDNIINEIYYIRKRILIKIINFSIKLTTKMWIYKQVSYLWRKYILKNLNNDKS